MDNGKPREGQLCRLVIDGYASDGAGVARLDGMVVFVQGGIRGEACDVRLTHVGRSALWGRVEEVVNPSPARIFPRCLHYTKCGGCQFRHMNYAEELEAKRIRVEDAQAAQGGYPRLRHPGGGAGRPLPQQGPVPGGQGPPHRLLPPPEP